MATLKKMLNFRSITRILDKFMYFANYELSSLLIPVEIDKEKCNYDFAIRNELVRLSRVCFII